MPGFASELTKKGGVSIWKFVVSFDQKVLDLSKVKSVIFTSFSEKDLMKKWRLREDQEEEFAKKFEDLEKLSFEEMVRKIDGKILDLEK